MNLSSWRICMYTKWNQCCFAGCLDNPQIYLSCTPDSNRRAEEQSGYVSQVSGEWFVQRLCSNRFCRSCAARFC